MVEVSESSSESILGYNEDDELEKALQASRDQMETMETFTALEEREERDFSLALRLSKADIGRPPVQGMTMKEIQMLTPMITKDACQLQLPRPTWELTFSMRCQQVIVNLKKRPKIQYLKEHFVSAQEVCILQQYLGQAQVRWNQLNRMHSRHFEEEKNFLQQQRLHKN